MLQKTESLLPGEREMNIHIALSDTHLGHPCTVLKTNAGVKRLCNTIEAETYGQRYTLVMLGDIIDMCYVTFAEAQEELKRFLNIIVEETNVSKVVWVIGNHDYHFLSREMEDRGDSRFSDNVYEKIITVGENVRVPVSLVYPEYFIWNKNKCMILSHGHLLGPDGSLFSLILGDPKESVADVCSINHSWLEFSWYNIWTDERVGNELWTGTSALSAFMVASSRGRDIGQMSKHINRWLVNTRKITSAVTKYIYGHTHVAEEKVIHLYHGTPNNTKLDNFKLQVINLGAWVIEKRVKNKQDEFMPPDTVIARIANGTIKITRVKYTRDYLKRIGNQGNIIHSAEWGLWITRPGP